VTDAPRAVVDVNVLVSAARTPNGLCGRLLEAAIDGRWRPVVSMMLFEELEDVLGPLTVAASGRAATPAPAEDAAGHADASP
jgi:hypothetical protein